MKRNSYCLIVILILLIVLFDFIRINLRGRRMIKQNKLSLLEQPVNKYFNKKVIKDIINLKFEMKG